MVQRAPATPAAAQGDVLVYPAAFFAQAQPANAYDMIARLPGFTFDAGDAAVRGFAGASGNVLIDGRRQATKDDLATVLKRIPASAVLRVELIRGGARGVDMQGQPVLANIVRRADAAIQGQVEASIGRYGDGRATPAVRANLSRQGGGTLTESSVYLYRTVDDEKGFGPRTRTNADGSTRERTLYDEEDGFKGGEASLAHERPLWGGKLRLTGSAKRGRERADTSLTTSFPAAGVERVVELETVDEAELGANWDGGVAPGLTAELIALQRLTRDVASERSDDGDEVETVGGRSHGGESIARALLRWQASPALTVEGGGEAAYNDLDSHAELAVDGVQVALPAADVRVTERRAEPFVTVTWKPAAALTLEAGGRVEISELRQTGDSRLVKRFTFPKPRLLATWDAGPRTQIRARFQREVGQLDFGDFVSSASLTSNTVTAGNAELEPDRHWVGELAWERRFWNAGALVLTGRYSAIQHVYDRVGVIGPRYAFDAPGNIGDGRLAELAASLTLPLDRLGLHGGLLKGRATVRDSAVDDPTTGARRAISGVTYLDGEAHLTQDLPRLRARWGVDLVLPETKPQFRFDEVRDERVGARWSVFAEWKPARRWTLRAYTDNLTGRGVARTRAIYAGARNGAASRYVERRDLATRPLIGLLLRRSFER